VGLYINRARIFIDKTYFLLDSRGTELRITFLNPLKKYYLPSAEVAPENSGRLLWGRLQDFQSTEILPPKM